MIFQCSELEKRINEVRDAIFKSFSSKAGVPSIREYEAKMEEDLTHHEQNLSSLKREQAEMEAEVERVRNSLTELGTKLERLEQHKSVPLLALSLFFVFVQGCEHLELGRHSQTKLEQCIVLSCSWKSSCNNIDIECTSL